MFEGTVAYYLNNYLGKYVYGLDQNSLKISVFKGDVVLRNLKLKPEALASLDLPVSVKSGLIGSLTLKVPWASLGRSPVLVELDRLYVLAGPKEDDVDEDSDQDIQDSTAAEEALKRRRVHDAETKWTSERFKLEKDEAPGGGGRFRAIIDTVIGNLQLSITNVHVRFEDNVSNDGEPFAMGFTLEKLTAHTVDENGKQTFATHSPMELLRKGSQLSRLALYFDVGKDLWLQEDIDWTDLAVDVWDTYFLPGISKSQGSSEFAPASYILQPIDGELRYLRRGPNVRTDDSQAIQEADIDLDAISLELKREQYQSLQNMLQLFSSFAARQPNLHLRPAGRPKNGKLAKAWWKYASVASMRGSQTQLNWPQISKMVSLRKKYVPAYVRCLQENLQGGDAEIEAMDSELPEQTIIVFRRLAHAQVEKKKRRAAAKAAAEYEEAKKNQGWVSWMMGGPPKPSSGQSDELRADLNDEEIEKLEEIVSEQEKAVQQDDTSASSLQMEVRVKIRSGSTALVDKDKSILRGGLQGLWLTAQKYPVTLGVSLALDGVSLTSAESVIATSGIKQDDPSDSLISGVPEIGQQSQAELKQALDLEFILKPQDGHADSVLNLNLAPSFITYDRRTVEQITEFFKTDKVLDYSALSAQAVARVEQARKAAQQQIASVLEAKPKLAMRLFLEAPKIAVPVPASNGSQDLTLVLDLGTFVVESDTETASHLGTEAAALYECLSLDGRDIGAYVVDGPFSFESAQKSLSGGDSDTPAESGLTKSAGAIMIPILERTGVSAKLQAARFEHASLPKLRLQSQLPRLRVYFSPARLSRLMTVIRAALPGGDSKVDTKDGEISTAAWRLQAEFEGPVRRLQWGGMGGTSAEWPRQYAVLHRGQLYLLDSKTSTQPLHVQDLFTDKRIVKLDPKYVGGLKHAIAVYNPSTSLANITEDKSALIIRLKNKNEVSIWYNHLASSARWMTELLGSEEGVYEDLDSADTESITSQKELQQVSSQLSVSSLVAEGADKKTGALVEVSLGLGEIALYVSGHPCKDWWPEQEGQRLEQPVTTDGVVNIDGEHSLLVVRAAEGSADATVGADQLSSSVAIGQFEIEDLLAGSMSHHHKHLARSYDDQVSGSEEEHGSLSKANLEDTEAPPEAASETKGKVDAAMALDFATWQRGSEQYDNVDAELKVRLTKLHFFCNRPTLGALMGIGEDIKAALGTQGSTEGSSGSSTPAGQEEDRRESSTSDLDGLSTSEDSQGEGAGLKLSGGEERVVFRLTAEVQHLAVSLLYEDAQSPPLAVASIDDFSFRLNVHPETLSLVTKLGNLQVQDGMLPEGHQYRDVCDLRRDATSSLVELQYETHPPAVAAQNNRIPDGLAFASIKAHMERLEVVFLSRFLFEILRYIQLLLALRPQPASGEALTSPEEQEDSKASQKEDAGQPLVLQLDVEMEAPVITLPRSSDSADAIKLDLGSLHVSNVVSWLTGTSLRDEKAILVEEDIVKLEGLGLCLISKGKVGQNIIHKYDAGTTIQIRRALKDSQQHLPKTAVGIEVPSIKATLSDTEYSLLTSIAGDNFKEQQLIPPSALLLEKQHAANPTEQESSSQQAAGQQSDFAAPEVAMDRAVAEVDPKKAPSVDRAADNIDLRLTVDVQSAELELLYSSLESATEHAPLARVAIGKLWLAYKTMSSGRMALSLSLPSLQAEDLRPGLPDAHRSIISAASTDGNSESAACASLLTMEFDTNPVLVSQSLKVRLQRPTITAEVSFMLAITKFFVPTLSLNESKPRPFQTLDILLGEEHKADQDLWLCPESRLIADSLDIQHYTYNGQGHRIILPEDMLVNDPQPLILIGPGKRLHLRDVTIVHADSLPACLQLDVGAQLVAEEADGVQLVNGPDKDLQDQDHPAPGSSGFEPTKRQAKDTGESGGIISSSRAFQSAYSRSTTRSRAVSRGLPGRSQAVSSLKIDFVALGVALRFLELAPDSQASGVGEARGGSQAYLVRMLAANLDAGGRLDIHGPSMKLKAQLKGLRLETAMELDRQAIQSRGLKGGTQVRSTILEPVTIGVSADMRAQQGSLELNVSNIRLNISPDILELFMTLQTSVLSPLLQPPPDKPVTTCSSFTKVVASQSTSRGGLDDIISSGSQEVPTFWRPQAPLGFGILGDCVTAGASQPSFQALAVAINSGLVAFPTGFKKVGYTKELTIWAPVPPPDYVALGHLVSQQDKKPSLKDVVCIHSCRVTACALGECLELGNGDRTPGDLRIWNVDNAGATFLACPTSKGSPQGPYLTLRSPLGMTAAMLESNVGGSAQPAIDNPPKKAESAVAVKPSLAKASYTEFNKTRRDLSQRSRKIAEQNKAVDFTRIWWDKMSKKATRHGMSIWRPVASAGYASLGDCIVSGYDPPVFTIVFQKNSETKDGKPLLEPPLDFRLVWRDESVYPRRALHIWYPVVPSGYKALGCMACVGERKPSISDMRCVRVEAVSQRSSIGQPIASLPPIGNRIGFKAWSTDERLGTFILSRGEDPPIRSALLEIHALDAPEQKLNHDNSEQGGMTLVVKTGHTSVLVRNAFRQPLAEIELGAIQASVRKPTPAVLQFYCGIHIAAWSFNPTIAAWEPVLEAWDLIVKVDANSGSTIEQGVDPGTHVTVKSTSEIVHVTLAYAAVTAAINSVNEWRDLAGGAAYRRQLAAADASSVHTLIDNQLGIGAQLQLDFGDRLISQQLAEGKQTPVLQPLARAPSRYTADENVGVSPEAFLPPLLLLDLRDATGLTSLLGCLDSSSAGKELLLKATYHEHDDEDAVDSCWGLRSRAIVASQDKAEWNELLVLELQEEGNFDIQIELWDLAMDPKDGCCLARGHLPIRPTEIQQGGRTPSTVDLKGLGAADGKTVKLATSISVVRQDWHHESEAPTDKWTSQGSTAGQRALHLEKLHKGWAVVPPPGLQKPVAVAKQLRQNLTGGVAPEAASTSLSVVCIGPDDGVLLESSFHEGLKKEVLRSLCQVANETRMDLEVALSRTELEDDWQSVGAISEGSSQAGDRSRVIIGVVKPGGSLPLPYGWRKFGNSVQVRPILEGSKERTHAWSRASRSKDSIDLGMLDDAVAQLRNCTALEQSVQKGRSGGVNSDLAVADIWLSMTVEGDDLSPEGGKDLMDWRIVISPPLTIQNQLPVKGTLLVWEKPEAGANLVMRQSCDIGQGESEHIHAADPRHAIHLQYYPEGYEWAEEEPVLVSHGFSNPQATRKPQQPLPWRFLVNAPRSAPQEIFMTRELNTDTLLRSDEGAYLEPGVAVARGTPMLLRIYVPLWIVNATELPITGLLTQLTQPPKAAEQEGSASNAAQSIKLRTLRTEHQIVDQRAQRAARLMSAGSLALWAFPQVQVQKGEQRKYYGISFKVGGSGWTEAIPLDSSAAANSNQASSKPVLIRARVPEWGTIHEFVSYLDFAGSGYERTLVMRLKPFCSISNRTGQRLQLLQWQSASCAQFYDDKAGGGTVVRNAVGGLPHAAATSRGQPSMGTAVRDSNVDWTSCMDLPEGLKGKAISLSSKTTSRTFCFRLVPSGSDQDLLSWSHPITVDTTQSHRKFLALPVSQRSNAHILPDFDTSRGDSMDIGISVLRYTIELQHPGCMHIVLENVSASPPHLLENKSPHNLQYRQAGYPGIPFQPLPAYSAAGFAAPVPSLRNEGSSSMATSPAEGLPTTLEEVELMGAEGHQDSGVRYPLDICNTAKFGVESQQMPHAEALHRLPVSKAEELDVAIVVARQEIMDRAGLQSLGVSANIGRGRLEHIVRLSPACKQRNAPLAVESNKQALFLLVDLSGIDVSLVDHVPEEILLLTMSGLRFESANGIGPGNGFSSRRVSIDNIQIDDQVATSRFPVLLTTAAMESEEGGAAQPLVQLSMVCQPGGAQGQVYYPYISFRVSKPLQIAVSETFIWRAVEMVQRMDLSSLADGQQNANYSASSDSPVRVSLLSVTDLSAFVSFRGDPLSRPRWAAAMSTLAWGLDMANFEAVPVRIQGFELEDEAMLSSALIQQILSIVKGQITAVAFSFLKNFGISGTSGVLGALSAGIGSLAGDQETDKERQRVRSEREITGFGTGLAEGGQSVASGLKRGFTGLVNKPLQGANKAGVSGFFSGVGKGLVGAVTNPASGTLDAFSSAFEGFDAAKNSLLGRARPQEGIRLRLPRAIGGDHKLLPFRRPPDNSEKQARTEEVGQSLLRGAYDRDTSAFSPIRRKRQRSSRTHDAYEEHLLLLEDRVVVLTDRAIVCIAAPGFASIQTAAETGRLIRAPDIQNAEIRWAVLWEDLLTLQLTRSRKDLDAEDRIQVHRKGVPGQENQEPLAHELHCLSGTQQAKTIKVLAERIWDKYYTRPRSDAESWATRIAEAESHDEQGGEPRQTLPATTLSMDYRRVWHSRRADNELISVWHPVCPAGYRPIGDVLSAGLDPPPQPVTVYRYSGKETGERRGRLSVEEPVDFQLIWRCLDNNAVSFWKPIPPPGFSAAGTLALPAVESPSRQDVLCVRNQDCQPAAVYDSPAWVYEPPVGGLALQRVKSYYPETWKCCLWQIDSNHDTFLAVRTFHKPPFGSAVKFDR